MDDSVKDVGGLEGLRKWLDEKKELLTPEKKDELRSKGLQPPRGILLVGVPGCGKSLSAKSISANWKLPLYRLDFATVQGSYVGQSEQQLKDALTTAENVSRRRRSVHQNGWTVSVLDAGMQKTGVCCSNSQ